ncbi:hypothetical protein B0T10DRAFT_493105 [Thelonectria olida]|uniref:Apple domain-containing protein n=1 Tax=Thelonectria olida TaxID=1576542 RepID=A0A9P8VYB6_9HYPO|nr:hypothetical protein B0T10DRAFT_493105 [Thelonectria olida]
MISLKTIALSCLALAPWGAIAGPCQPTSTSTTNAPCPAYTLITPSPKSKACAKEVTRGSFQTSPYFLTFPWSTSLEGCAKLCGDWQGCVSFYVEMYRPAPGAQPFPICALFSAYEKDLGFGEGDWGKYYELGCFACDRAE